METIQPYENVSTKKAGSIGRIVLGVLFLLPSLFCCIFQLFLPTLGTFLMSFQKISPIGSENVYVGLKNYAGILGNESFWRAAGFTLTTLLVRLLIVALVPVLLAWAVSQFERRLRLGLRILLTLPVAFFVPVAIAIAWLMSLNPSVGLFPLEKSWAATPASARSTLLFIDALYLLGLISGLGLMVYLPLWRRSADVPQPTFQEVLKPTLTISALGILGVIALSLNTFTLSWVLTRGGPVGSTSTLAILLYQFGFVRFQMGPAASVASLILLVTMILGIAAGLLVILTRLRLDIIDTRSVLEKASEPDSPKRSLVLPWMLTLLTLVICLFSALPFGWLVPQALGKGGLGRLLEQVSVGRLFINTFVPPLVTATLQVLIAYLAALSMGALQPLGKRSEWLLLLFSPWLFITVLPLSLVNFLAVQKAHMLGTLPASLSPILFSIPALFILTLFFAARASQQQPAPDFFKHFILPSLPLAAVLWLALIIFNGQEVLWPLLVSVSPARYSLNLTLLQLAGMFSGAGGMLATAITFFVLPACVFFFLCLAPFQIFYLDRLTLYTESPSTTGKP